MYLKTLGYHRLWFDVLLSNQRAQALYRSEGFVVEGRLRDGWKTASGYEDMLLMSMLAHEYQTSGSSESSDCGPLSNDRNRQICQHFYA